MEIFEGEGSVKKSGLCHLRSVFLTKLYLITMDAVTKFLS